jgi:hypothetical protein
LTRKAPQPKVNPCACAAKPATLPQDRLLVHPARAGSRQRFEAGQVMPEVGGDYGATIWQWDDQQG